MVLIAIVRPPEMYSTVEVSVLDIVVVVGSFIAGCLYVVSTTLHGVNKC